MTSFKATFEHWAQVTFWATKDSGGSACILELRDRVERLELGAGIHDSVAKALKPPSLKEQALGALGRFTANTHTHWEEMVRDFDIIRQALEQLDD